MDHVEKDILKIVQQGVFRTPEVVSRLASSSVEAVGLTVKIMRMLHEGKLRRGEDDCLYKP